MEDRNLDAFGRLRVSNPHTLFDSKQKSLTFETAGWTLLNMLSTHKHADRFSPVDFFACSSTLAVVFAGENRSYNTGDYNEVLSQ